LIAEGIEHEWQRDIFVDLGVRYMQGFLFGHPQPATFYTGYTEQKKEA
jgi:EAL domain-containing protein (putative c-di-GMP-specific phosphodiesterase class I)